MKCREWSVDSSLLAHIPRRSTMEDRAGSLLLAVFSLASRACVQALLDRSRKTVGPREWSSPPTKNGFRKADSVVVHRPCHYPVQRSAIPDRSVPWLVRLAAWDVNKRGERTLSR